MLRTDKKTHGWGSVQDYRRIVSTTGDFGTCSGELARILNDQLFFSWTQWFLSWQHVTWLRCQAVWFLSSNSDISCYSLPSKVRGIDDSGIATGLEMTQTLPPWERVIQVVGLMMIAQTCSNSFDGRIFWYRDLNISSSFFPLEPPLACPSKVLSLALHRCAGKSLTSPRFCCWFHFVEDFFLHIHLLARIIFSHFFFDL